MDSTNNSVENMALIKYEGPASLITKQFEGLSIEQKAITEHGESPMRNITNDQPGYGRVPSYTSAAKPLPFDWNAAVRHYEDSRCVYPSVNRDFDPACVPNNFLETELSNVPIEDVLANVSRILDKRNKKSKPQPLAKLYIEDGKIPAYTGGVPTKAQLAQHMYKRTREHDPFGAECPFGKYCHFHWGREWFNKEKKEEETKTFNVHEGDDEVAVLSDEEDSEGSETSEDSGPEIELIEDEESPEDELLRLEQAISVLLLGSPAP